MSHPFKGKLCGVHLPRPGFKHHECYTENNLAGKSQEWLVGICAKCHPAADRRMRERWYRQDAPGTYPQLEA